jgi:tRNA-specific 2-thiouridylase
MPKKVMIGMSGGVDSSVAAALLLEKGYDVIGVTMQLWPDQKSETQIQEGGCCSLSAVDDARRVANQLGIPYYVMNFKEVFQNKVIDYFLDEYGKGRTPNPCIACNQHVKFEALLSKAMSMNIDYIATGHYARITYDTDINRFSLKRAITHKKDQSYALYTLTQEQLSRALMPVGEYEKDHVRKLAKEMGLAVATKPDSQEICFIEDNDYGRYMKENAQYPITPGEFVDTKGAVLGTHKGIVYYTIGQRKGLGITFGKPMYVVDIDVDKNRIILGDEKEVFSDYLMATNMNYIPFEKLDSPLRVKAKVRYLANESEAVIIPKDKNSVEVVFDTPQRAITPGQSVVFYAGDNVIGGGIIEENRRNKIGRE